MEAGVRIQTRDVEKWKDAGIHELEAGVDPLERSGEHDSRRDMSGFGGRWKLELIERKKTTDYDCEYVDEKRLRRRPGYDANEGRRPNETAQFHTSFYRSKATRGSFIIGLDVFGSLAAPCEIYVADVEGGRIAFPSRHALVSKDRVRSEKSFGLRRGYQSSRL